MTRRAGPTRCGAPSPRLPGWVAALLLAVVAGPAMAAPPAARADAGLPRALIVPSVLQGRGAGKVGEWDARIDARLLALGVVVVPARLSEDELRCAQIDCLERLRQRHGVDLALRARIDAEPLGVKVRLLLVRAGEARSSVDQAECAECSVDAAARRLDELIARALGATPGVLAPGPARAATPAGPEVGELRSLEGGPSPSPLPPARPRWLTATEVMLGVIGAGGLVAAGFGIRLLHDDGLPACGLAAPATQCPRVYDTGGLGAGLVAVGAVLAVGAAVGIGVVEVRLGRGRSARAALAPMAAPRGGVGLQLEGAF
jgi:hypothetical protein